MVVALGIKNNSAIEEMYGYNGIGWKPTSSNSNSSSSSNSGSTIGQSLVVATPAHHCDVSKDTAAEGEDELDLMSEEKDVAAPLPTSDTRHLKVKTTSAKDKRRLREKRRSTGVASLTGHEADEETTRNTLLNETAAVSSAAAAAADGMQLENHQTYNCGKSTIAAEDALTTQSQQPIPSHNGSTVGHQQTSTDVTSCQMSVQSLRIHDDGHVHPSECQASGEPTPNSHHITMTSSDFPRNLCARPFEAKRSILKSNSRPVVPTKPEVFAGVSTCSIQQSQRLNEESRMLARVAELEKLLECERRETTLMKQYLSEKDCRIRELELHIANLNEDLDLADEDYLRLEEENRALARALVQLNAAD